MVQKDKDLLLKDLCARLPYNVNGLVTFNGNLFMTAHQIEDRTIDGKLYDRFAKFQDSWYNNVTIKPYLFPLSSMTEEQRDEFLNIQSEDRKVLLDALVKYRHEKEDALPIIPLQKHIDWLNANHFDYRDRGLIPMGLAKDATGLNIY